MMMIMMMMMMNCSCGMIDQRKAFSLISSGDHCQMCLSVLTIANLWHAASRVWACAESEFRFSWMKLCSGDNHYTTAPLTQFFVKRLVNWLKNKSFGKASRRKSVVKSDLHKLINGDKLSQHVGQRVDQY